MMCTSDAAVSSTRRGRVDDDPKNGSRRSPRQTANTFRFRRRRLASSIRPRPQFARCSSLEMATMESLVLVVQIACGGMHTVALTADNKIIAWGVNDNCALGRDATWDEKLRDMDAESGEEEDGELNPLESTPTQVASRHLAADAVFVQVATGDSCSFALTETGLVYGWGTFRDSKGDERFGYEADGKMITKQDKPSLIQGVQDITQLACGVEHVLALDTRGNIWGWGNNEQNQLGRRLFGRDQDSLIPHQIRVCRNNAKYIASKDNVWGWGLNSFGEAGDPDTAGTNSAVLPYPMKIRTLAGKGITCLDGGAHHSAAVTLDSECFVWGRMDGGQLGFTFTPEQLQDAAQGQLGLNSEEDVEVAQRVKGRDADEAVLTWSGAGGQFSVISAPATLG
ncbi:hypothetical protein BN1723_004402 [Verticillium longisporum]|uniref:RCC1-like domain-containing protein n=1 Tax=Verticillium longisporum TaxID=100787 RepID=A0A0G4MV07_VERLO|nr:hypothetical protein BN1723_004402 [Verticillium longisporum]